MLRSAVACTTLLVLTSLAGAAESGLAAYTNPQDAGPDFQTQGEYRGEIESDGQRKRSACT